MAPSIPLPVRVAVGLVITGWDTVRNLPTELPALSVSIAGHAVRLSMRVQQEITELAARGDELLAAVTSRPSEHPTWAHFDDEDTDASITAHADPEASEDAGRPTTARSMFDEVELDVDVAWVAVGDEVFNDDAETVIDLDVVIGDLDGDGEIDIAAVVIDDGDLADNVALADNVERAEDEDADDSDGTAADAPENAAFPPPYLHVVPDAAASDDLDEQRAAAPDPLAAPDVAAPDVAAADALTTPDAPGAERAVNGAGGPVALPGYDRMTLAQVRGRLRGLSPNDVAGLLAYEQAGAGRAPFLTLLSNRMATLEHEPQ